MIKVLIHFMYRREYILWLLGGFLLIWFSNTALFHLSLSYLNTQSLEVSDIYFINALLLPFAFGTSQDFINIAVEVCFLSVLFFPFLHMISYFLKDSPSNTILKKGRRKWLNEMFLVMAILCVFVVLLYVCLTYLFLITQFHVCAFDESVIYAVIYKLILAFLSFIIYLWAYIRFDESSFPLFMSISSYFIGNLLLRFLSINYIGVRVVYNYIHVFVIIFLSCLLLIYFNTLKHLRKRDL